MLSANKASARRLYSFTTVLMLASCTSKVTHDFLRPFLKSITRPQGKALLAFIKAMIQGKTSVLCQMGREVQKNIMPKSFCEKMGRHLEKIKDLHLKPLLLAPKTGWELIIVDSVDVQKPYAETLPWIHTIRDGSTGNLYGKGFGVYGVIGKHKSEGYLPLALSRYEEEKPGFMQLVDTILGTLSPDHGALWVLDRGFDDLKVFTKLLDNHQGFLVRLDRAGGDRCLITSDGEKHRVGVLLQHFEGKDVGYRIVHLPGRAEPLALIHYQHKKHGQGLALLTTQIPKTEKQAIRTAKLYLKRWKVEDYFRFIKQRFGIECLMIQLEDRLDGLLAGILIASALVMKLMQSVPIEMKAVYEGFLKKNRAKVSWSSFARFLSDCYDEWTLIFRTYVPPDKPLALAPF